MAIFEWCNNFILLKLSLFRMPLLAIIFAKKKFINQCLYAFVSHVCLYVHKKILLTQGDDIVSCLSFLLLQFN